MNEKLATWVNVIAVSYESTMPPDGENCYDFDVSQNKQANIEENHLGRRPSVFYPNTHSIRLLSTRHHPKSMHMIDLGGWKFRIRIIQTHENNDRPDRLSAIFIGVLCAIDANSTIIFSGGFNSSRSPIEWSTWCPLCPSGFRPNKPFHLPGEYIPPTVDDSALTEQQQQYDPNRGFSYEVSKQRVEFAGQEVQSFPISQPHRNYGAPPPPPSPSNNDHQPGFINNHDEIPHHHGGRPFFDQPPRQRPSGGNQRPFQRRPSERFPPQQRPQPNNPQQGFFSTQPLPNPTTDERFEPQQNLPETQPKPAAQYGAPINVDPRYAGSEQQDNIDELQKQYALDALNAAVDNYNRLQEKSSDRITQGQYFIVNPDQTIQKVQFTTKQTEQEADANDFTAELKYSKVGELKDPLYKYNAEGQLVRIVKK
ncbi:uncharacterized protein LOC142239523 [Haematobia irritans]|uniref:uncharacterized protein LOC142239523 n=1 Tax=Haematobia irritans TaxID=7368 RepID=UPI003F4FAFAA